MGRALQPPEPNAYNVALEASGAIIGGNWHRAFYAHLDAFLSTARSVPEIIQCCFGVDPVLKAWFNALDPAERDRRRQFNEQFKAAYDTFRALDLGTARHISEHRAGYPPVEVKVSGFFGVVYDGSPIKRVPVSETRKIDDPQYAFLARPMPVQPNWQDFTIDGKGLFDECTDYVTRAQALIDDAFAISGRVHGSNAITPPPA